MRSESNGAAEKLHCDLASLLPLTEGGEQDPNGDLALLPSRVKMEDLDEIELPPSEDAQGGTKLVNPAVNFMDNLTSDETCSDLVSTFVNDVVTDPVSLDDFMI